MKGNIFFQNFLKTNRILKHAQFGVRKNVQWSGNYFSNRCFALIGKSFKCVWFFLLGCSDERVVASNWQAKEQLGLELRSWTTADRTGKIFFIRFWKKKSIIEKFSNLKLPRWCFIIISIPCSDLTIVTN